MGAPMTPELQAIQSAFGLAAEKFMEAWLNDYAERDPASGAAAMRVLLDGGFATIATSAAPLTNALSCTLTVTDKHGCLSPLGSVAFES